MFNPIRALARPMLASMFIAGGLDAVRNPESKVSKSDRILDPLAEQVPALEQLDSAEVVRLNGAVQVAGGALLAMGKLPRLASAALAASLVPTTLAGHRFWEEDDPKARANQQIHFLKNVSMLGGLLISLFDREGEPSAAWRAKHAAEHVSIKAEHAKKEAGLAAAATAAKAREKKAEAKVKVAEAKGAGKVATKAAAREAKLNKDLVAAKAAAKKEQLMRETADARAAAGFAGATVAREASHKKSQLETEAALAKRKAIPDARHAAKLVRAFRD